MSLPRTTGEAPEAILARINAQSAHLKTRRYDRTLHKPARLGRKVKDARVATNQGQVPMVVKTDRGGTRELREIWEDSHEV